MTETYAIYFLIAMNFCRYDKFTLDVNAKECVNRVYQCMKARNQIDKSIQDCVIK